MRQTLFVIPYELFDVPVFGWGWVLGAVALAATVITGYQIRQHGFNAESRGLISLFAVVAVFVVFVLPRLEKHPPEQLVSGLPIRGYGSLVLVGVLLGIADARRRASTVGIHPETILSLAFWMFLCGIAGARIFYMVQKFDTFSPQSLSDAAVQFVSITEGGLVVYGGLIGGLLAVVVFAYRQRLPLLTIGDVIAPSMLLGLAIGRIGCLMNGCCYGGVCTDPQRLTIQFPRFSAFTKIESPTYVDQHAQGLLHGVRIVQDKDGLAVGEIMRLPAEIRQDALEPGDRIVAINGQEVSSIEQAGERLSQTGPTIALTKENQEVVSWTIPELPSMSLPVYPTQIYSSINALLLYSCLALYFPFRHHDGAVFAALLTIYPVTRFLLELIRSDEGSVFGTDFTISQNVSLSLLVFVVALWAYVLKGSRTLSTSKS